MLLTQNYLIDLFKSPLFKPEEIEKLLTNHGLEVEMLKSMTPSYQVERAEIIEIFPEKIQCRLTDGQIKSLPYHSQAKIGQQYALTQIDGQFCWVTPNLLGWSSLTSLMKMVPGQSFEESWETNDLLIEISITPNRGDCLSYLGVAREIYLADRKVLDKNDIIADLKERYPVTWAGLTKVQAQIESAVCSSYALTRFEFNSNVETPFWLERFLMKHGLQPRHLMVDIGNYMMLVFGQPFHAFDENNISYPLEVKQIHPQDLQLDLLTGKSLKITYPIAVVGSQQDIYALAGLVGSQASSVTERTRSVLVEAASFAPSIIRKMRMTGMTTDSSLRFERGVDVNHQEDLLTVMAGILQSIDPSLKCYQPELIVRHKKSDLQVSLKHDDISKLVGMDLNQKEVNQIVHALGGFVKDDYLSWIVPSWRFDISIKADFIEEIVRLYGLDRLAKDTDFNFPPRMKMAQTVLEPWVQKGFQEVITYSFISHDKAVLFNQHATIQLQNPISQELKVMRPCVWSSLLDILAMNSKFGHLNLKLVEQAPIYDLNYPLYQKNVVSAVIPVESNERNWYQSEKKKVFDFYEIKGLLQSVVPKGSKLEYIPTENQQGLHPHLQFHIIFENEIIGIVGQLHPALAQEQGWPIAWLIQLDEILFLKNTVQSYQSFAKTPKIRRDLALIVPETLSVNKIITFIENNKTSALQSVHVFDYYSGEHVTSGYVSVGIELVFQDQHKTLEDHDIGLMVQQLLSDLNHEYRITLRD